MVPFESLGPGQSGRLVYQVMGKVGPIFNPTGIKYLPPDMADIGSNAISASADIAAGLSGINLALSRSSSPEVWRLRLQRAEWDKSLTCLDKSATCPTAARFPPMFVE